VVIVGILTGGWIMGVVGKDLTAWLDSHVAATRAIAQENFQVRIAQLRSDDFGQLTDAFNRMAADLGRGRQVHQMFGHFVGPEVRDQLMARYAGLGGTVQEITVLFADIRDFTQRSTGKSPEEVVELLNRFLSLGVAAIEGRGGWVNKFLGDGFMALFGAPLPRPDHGDLALEAAGDLLGRLEDLNRALEAQDQAPLRVGVGIHTGPALVGFIGATVALPDGQEQMRLEFTAIGETVNVTQRVEQLTKSCGQTLLLSDATRSALRRCPPLHCVGPQPIRGGGCEMVLYTLGIPADKS
jgi:adenylate cyclase